MERVAEFQLVKLLRPQHLASTFDPLLIEDLEHDPDYVTSMRRPQLRDGVEPVDDDVDLGPHYRSRSFHDEQPLAIAGDVVGETWRVDEFADEDEFRWIPVQRRSR